MKLTYILLSVLITLSVNNITHAKTDIDIKDCPIQTVTTVYISYTETIDASTDLGKQYETFINSVEALPKTGNFNNFKITAQDMRTRSLSNSSTSKEVSMNVTVEFDLNYQAVTDINKNLKNSNLDATTYQRKRCQ